MSKEKRLVPELRFPNYKYLWKTTEYRDIFKWYNGLSGKNKDDFMTGSDRYISYMEVFKYISISKLPESFVRINEGESQNTVNKHDVLFTQSSETLNEVGISSVYLLDDPVYLNSFCFGGKIRNKKEFHPIFLSLALSSHHNRRKIIKEGQGSTRFNLSPNRLNNVILCTPEFEEQQKIATFLSLVDKKIELLEKKVKLLEEQKRGLLQKTFSQEIRFKRDDGSEFQEWEIVKLEDVATIKKGIQLSKQDMIDGAPFYVLNGGKTVSGFTDKYNTNEETISISEGGESCGYVSFNKEKFWAGGHLYILNNVSINKMFLFQYLKYKESKIMRLRVGSGLPNIQKGPLLKLITIKPKIDEQILIADFLSKHDLLIDNTKQKLEKTKGIKKGLLQKMFV